MKNMATLVICMLFWFSASAQQAKPAPVNKPVQHQVNKNTGISNSQSHNNSRTDYSRLVERTKTESRAPAYQSSEFKKERITEESRQVNRPPVQLNQNFVSPNDSTIALNKPLPHPKFDNSLRDQEYSYCEGKIQLSSLEVFSKNEAELFLIFMNPQRYCLSDSLWAYIFSRCNTVTFLN